MRNCHSTYIRRHYIRIANEVVVTKLHIYLHYVYAFLCRLKPIMSVYTKRRYQYIDAIYLHETIGFLYSYLLLLFVNFSGDIISI